VDLEEEVLDRTGEHLATTAGIFLAVVIMVVFAASRIARSVTRPVRRLTSAAKRIAGGNLDVRADIHTGDELQELADTMDQVLPYLRDRVEIRNALNLAKEVQQNLLPKAPPWVDGLDVAGRSIYCDETGGDYYDYFPPGLRGPGKLAIAVGDVAGHGVGPALLMATARALLRSRVRRERHLFEICGEVNRELSEDTDAGRFMTLFLMEVDGPGRMLRWICAGHDHALLYDPVEDRFTELGGEDIALGIEEGWEYREHSHGGLTGGEVILIGTDGIKETRNLAGEFFGTEALSELIRKNHQRGAAELVDSVTSALADFRGARAQEDDVTLVVVRMLEGLKG
jgi:sigma-B regulation protein RsbU (phosphoserine phosphatase)